MFEKIDVLSIRFYIYIKFFKMPIIINYIRKQKQERERKKQNFDINKKAK